MDGRPVKIARDQGKKGDGSKGTRIYDNRRVQKISLSPLVISFSFCSKDAIYGMKYEEECG